MLIPGKFRSWLLRSNWTVLILLPLLLISWIVASTAIFLFRKSVEHQGFMVDLKSMWFNFYPEQLREATADSRFSSDDEKLQQKDREFYATEVGLHGEACNALVQPREVVKGLMEKSANI